MKIAHLILGALASLAAEAAMAAIARSSPCLPWVVGAILLVRSEEHTSELQSQSNLVCRLLLEKKKTEDKDRSSFLGSTRTAPSGPAPAHAPTPYPHLAPRSPHSTFSPPETLARHPPAPIPPSA